MDTATWLEYARIQPRVEPEPGEEWARGHLRDGDGCLEALIRGSRVGADVVAFRPVGDGSETLHCPDLPHELTQVDSGPLRQWHWPDECDAPQRIVRV